MAEENAQAQAQEQPKTKPQAFMQTANDYTNLWYYVDAINQILAGKGSKYEQLKLRDPDIDAKMRDAQGRISIKAINENIIKKYPYIFHLGNVVSHKGELERMANYTAQLGAVSADAKNGIPTTNDVDKEKAKYDKLRSDAAVETEKSVKDTKDSFKAAKKANTKARRKAFRWAMLYPVITLLPLALIGGLGFSIWGVVSAAVTSTFGLTSGAAVAGILTLLVGIKPAISAIGKIFSFANKKIKEAFGLWRGKEGTRQHLRGQKQEYKKSVRDLQINQKAIAQDNQMENLAPYPGNVMGRAFGRQNEQSIGQSNDLENIDLNNFRSVSQQPAPTQTVPTQTTPTQTAPTQTEPTQTVPTQPAPTQPVSMAPTPTPESTLVPTTVVAPEEEVGEEQDVQFSNVLGLENATDDEIAAKIFEDAEEGKWVDLQLLKEKNNIDDSRWEDIMEKSQLGIDANAKLEPAWIQASNNLLEEVDVPGRRIPQVLDDYRKKDAYKDVSDKDWAKVKERVKTFVPDLVDDDEEEVVVSSTKSSSRTASEKTVKPQEKQPERKEEPTPVVVEEKSSTADKKTATKSKKDKTATKKVKPEEVKEEVKVEEVKAESASDFLAQIQKDLANGVSIEDVHKKINSSSLSEDEKNAMAQVAAAFNGTVGTPHEEERTDERVGQELIDEAKSMGVELNATEPSDSLELTIENAMEEDIKEIIERETAPALGSENKTKKERNAEEKEMERKTRDSIKMARELAARKEQDFIQKEIDAIKDELKDVKSSKEFTEKLEKDEKLKARLKKLTSQKLSAEQKKSIEAMTHGVQLKTITKMVKKGVIPEEELTQDKRTSEFIIFTVKDGSKVRQLMMPTAIYNELEAKIKEVSSSGSMVEVARKMGEFTKYNDYMLDVNGSKGDVSDKLAMATIVAGVSSSSKSEQEKNARILVNATLRKDETADLEAAVTTLTTPESEQLNSETREPKTASEQVQFIVTGEKPKAEAEAQESVVKPVVDIAAKFIGATMVKVSAGNAYVNKLALQEFKQRNITRVLQKTGKTDVSQLKPQDFKAYGMKAARTISFGAKKQVTCIDSKSIENAYVKHLRGRGKAGNTKQVKIEALQAAVKELAEANPNVSSETIAKQVLGHALNMARSVYSYKVPITEAEIIPEELKNKEKPQQKRYTIKKKTIANSSPQQDKKEEKDKEKASKPEIIEGKVVPEKPNFTVSGAVHSAERKLDSNEETKDKYSISKESVDKIYQAPTESVEKLSKKEINEVKKAEKASKESRKDRKAREQAEKEAEEQARLQQLREKQEQEEQQNISKVESLLTDYINRHPEHATTIERDRHYYVDAMIKNKAHLLANNEAGVDFQVSLATKQVEVDKKQEQIKKNLLNAQQAKAKAIEEENARRDIEIQEAIAANNAKIEEGLKILGESNIPESLMPREKEEPSNGFPETSKKEEPVEFIDNEKVDQLLFYFDSMGKAGGSFDTEEFLEKNVTSGKLTEAEANAIRKILSQKGQQIDGPEPGSEE